MKLQFNFSKIYMYVYFLWSIGAPVVLLVPLVQGEKLRSELFVLSWLVFYLVTAVLFIFNARYFTRRDIPFLFIPLLVLISSLFTGRVSETAPYAISYVFNALAALMIVSSVDVAEFPRLFGRFLLSFCVVGFLLYGLGLEAAVYSDVHQRDNLLGGDPMRGIFSHKITSGVGGAIALLIVTFCEKGFFRTLSQVFLIFYILCTGSSLALGALGVTILSAPFLLKIRKVRAPGLILFISFGLIIFIGSLTFGYIAVPVLELLGRDVTLTGRTLLWDWGIQVFYERPIFGWGYQGYFGSNEAIDGARSFREFYSYDVPHFHNSFVQISVEMGLLGFFVYVYFLSTSFSFWCHRSISFRNYMSIVFVIFFLIFASFFMNQIHLYNNFNSLFLLIVILYSLRGSEAFLMKNSKGG